MRLPCLFFLVLLSNLPFLLFAQNKPPRHQKLPPELKEVSGMVRLPSGDLWLLNDSKNPPLLFRYDPVSRKMLETRRMPFPNRDWEDLTCDPQGNLYIGDFGNNYNKRRDLRIYRYNPQSGAIDSILFAYPDQQFFPPEQKEQWNFNCEAMIYFNDSLHLFSKNAFKGNFVSKHYILPARPGVYTATLRDSIKFKNRVITGAGLSRDQKTVVFTSYIIGTRLGFIPYTKCSVFYITNFTGSNFFKGHIKRRRLPKFLIARQYESVTQWDGNTWLIANEGRKPQFQAIWRLHRK